MSKKQKERELEELKKIIGANDTGTGWIRWDEEVDLLAKKIQQAGYTKDPFPIEELEAWVEREKKKPGIIRAGNFQLVLDKIKELKG